VDETRRLFPFVAGMLGVVHKGFDVTSQGAAVHVPANATVVGAFYLTQHAPEVKDGGTIKVKRPGSLVPRAVRCPTPIRCRRRRYHAQEWTDPWAFDPDRFARGEPRSGYGWAWTPHGAPKGRHHCPGVDLTTQLMLAFMAQVYRDGCTWEVPPGQPSPTKQRLSLFNPEPAGSTFYGWRCAAYPRPDEYQNKQREAMAAQPATAATAPPAAAATAAPAPTPVPVPLGGGGSGRVEGEGL
jgi:hypothetical protein